MGGKRGGTDGQVDDTETDTETEDETVAEEEEQQVYNDGLEVSNTNFQFKSSIWVQLYKFTCSM